MNSKKGHGFILKKGASETFLYLLMLVILIAVLIITRFNGLYGQDAFEYARYTNRLSIFLHKGTDPGKFYWPVGYPLISSIVNLVLNNYVLSLQVVSMVSFVLSALYLNRLLHLINGNERKDTIYFVLIFFFFSPYMFRSAFLVMSESLSVLCLTGAFYHVFSYAKSKHLKDFSLATLFILFSIITRYADFVIVLIPSIYLLVLFIKNFNYKGLLIGSAILALTVLPHIIIYQSRAMNFLGHEWLREWSFNNYFLHSFHTADGYETYPIFNFLYPLLSFVHPAFIICGLLFLVCLRKKYFDNPFYIIVISSLLLYFLFLSGIPYQNLRFLIPSFPLVLLLLFSGFCWLKNNLIKNKFSTCLLVLLIGVQCALIYKYSIGIYNLNTFQKRVATKVVTLDTSKTIYTFYLVSSLKYYGVKNNIVNLYDGKIKAVPPGSYVLFDENEFKKQWKNKLPMINWEFIKSNYKLKVIYKFPDMLQQNGWALYQTVK